MRLLLCWLALVLCAWGEGGRLLSIDCVPRDFQVSLSRDGGWQACPRNADNQFPVPAGDLQLRLQRQGYQTLQVEVPASARRWPPRLNQVLSLAPLVIQATFATQPSGAQVFLILPGGREEYLGLSGQPLSLNLARVTGGSGQGFFEIEFRHSACQPTRVPIASYALSPEQTRWPRQGSLPLTSRFLRWLAALPLALGALWLLLRERVPRAAGRVLPSLGDYWIEQPLGQGASGKVFRARQRRNGSLAAIKVLHPQLADQPAQLAAFRREAALLAELDHPNLVKVLEWGEDLGRPYLVMELVEGCDLRTALAVDPLGASALVPLLTQAAAGLALAHSRQVIHRDIKPENLVITPEGRACWVDFGLAEVAPTGGDASGTVGYLAPERIAGQPATPASDQYALGVLAYEALTGLLPSGKSELARLRPTLDAGLVAVLERMLAHHPADRYASLHEVERALWSYRR